MIEKVDAIVLNTRKFGDSSKIATIYSRKFGRLSVLAKGAFKAKSQFAGNLETLSHIEAKIYFKQNKDLQTLSEVNLIKYRGQISKNQDKLGLAFIFSEIILKTQREGEINPDLFDNLIEFFDGLNDSNDFYGCGIILLVQIISYSGYLIDPNVDNGDYFSTKKGKFYEQGPRSHYLENNLAEKFRLLIQGKNCTIDKLDFRIIFDFLIQYLSYHIDREIKLNCMYLLD